MGRLDEPMRIIAIMEHMHWSYDEYMNTPNHIITLTVEKMRRDIKEQELQSKRNGK